MRLPAIAMCTKLDLDRLLYYGDSIHAVDVVDWLVQKYVPSENFSETKELRVDEGGLVGADGVDGVITALKSVSSRARGDLLANYYGFRHSRRPEVACRMSSTFVEP